MVSQSLIIRTSPTVMEIKIDLHIIIKANSIIIQRGRISSRPNKWSKNVQFKSMMKISDKLYKCKFLERFYVLIHSHNLSKCTTIG